MYNNTAEPKFSMIFAKSKQQVIDQMFSNLYCDTEMSITVIRRFWVAFNVNEIRNTEEI